MSYVCKSCPSGNCEGCKNGEKWCDDPRCFPYCRGCALIKDHETISAIGVWIIIATLLMITFLLFIAYGPRMVEYRVNGVRVKHSVNGEWLDETYE